MTASEAGENLMTDQEMKGIVCRHMQGAFDCYGVADDGGHTLRFFAEVEVLAARLAAPDATAMREQAHRILEDWFEAMQQVPNETRNRASSTTSPSKRYKTAFGQGLTHGTIQRWINSLLRGLH